MRLSRGKWFLIGSLTASAIVGAGANVSRFFGPKPDPAQALHIVVNIPASRLEVFRGDSLLQSFPVSPGRRGFETPAGRYRITHIVWNPWWRPPESKWARGEKPVSPGPGNPMGLAKLFFDDLYYIHGTPEVEHLGEPASHGCVRMANGDVLQVARLVQEYGSPRTPVDMQGLFAEPRVTRTVWLQNPVTLEVRYAVAEVRKGKLEIHPDVYGAARGSVKKRVVEALVQNGYAYALLDQERVDALVERARSGAVSVPVDSLLATRAVAGGMAQR